MDDSYHFEGLGCGHLGVGGTHTHGQDDGVGVDDVVQKKVVELGRVILGQASRRQLLW